MLAQHTLILSERLRLPVMYQRRAPKTYQLLELRAIAGTAHEESTSEHAHVVPAQAKNALRKGKRRAQCALGGLVPLQ